MICSCWLLLRGAVCGLMRVVWFCCLLIGVGRCSLALFVVAAVVKVCCCSV